MRMIQNLNKDWYFTPSFDESMVQMNGIDHQVFEKVRLPHHNIELPYNYFDDKAFRFVSCYKRELVVPNDYQNKRIFIDFEGIMSYAKVYVNGKVVGEHKGGYTPFSIDLTDYIQLDATNILTVMVDSTERPDIPPFGGVIDYLTYGGIYREVQLRYVDPIHIQDIYLVADQILEDQKTLNVNLKLSNVNEQYTLKCKVLDGDQVISSQEVAATKLDLSMTFNQLNNINLWDIDNPYLYQVEVSLENDNTVIDQMTTRFGFREAMFKPDGFYLNGRRIKLIGLNRHQAYPYVGYAMPKRAQQKDADLLKEYGLNMVRTSHYPQSRHFLDRCDEIGLLVFEEIPGWQYIGDDIWQQQVLRDVEEMIVRDRNRPSIVIWGVRINESQDNHDLYVKTNALAKALDPTRQTGGVRYLSGSELLEDVYTMNDFIHDGGVKKHLAKYIKNFATYDDTSHIDGEEVALRNQKEVTKLEEYVPYLITEYNGHMYPTKRFDQEERVMEHALRHARVQNASFGDDYISGAIGWCAFDYNTHADFGSGDKICYHGVMDMFRIPKFAAYAYKSQKVPEKEAVLEPVTYWSRGERSIGGVIPLIIFTNCDEIELYYGNELKGKYQPDRERFAYLPHPPIIIDELTGYWGMEWEDARFVGYVGGEAVVEKNYSRNPIPTKIEVVADDPKIIADEVDVTRVVVKAVDQLGNTLTFLSDPINVEVRGAGELIGPKQLSLIGGSTAFWIRNKEDEKGAVKITVDSSRFESQTIHIEVE